MEHIIVKCRIVFAGSLAIRRECDLQQLRFHRLRVDHNVDAVDCSAVVVMHLRIFCCYRNKNVSQHLLYLLVDRRPVYLIVTLKFLDKILIFDLLEVGHCPIVHNSKLGLVGREMSAVSSVVIVGRPYPEIFVEEQS
jgi:hypothetical protein